jgi:nucleoside-diphosphate-sugar epimerase
VICVDNFETGSLAGIALARELLGWQPTVELAEGLTRTIEAMGPRRLVGTV